MGRARAGIETSLLGFVLQRMFGSGACGDRMSSLATKFRRRRLAAVACEHPRLRRVSAGFDSMVSGTCQRTIRQAGDRAAPCRHQRAASGPIQICISWSRRLSGQKAAARGLSMGSIRCPGRAPVVRKPEGCLPASPSESRSTASKHLSEGRARSHRKPAGAPSNSGGTTRSAVELH